MQHYVCAGDCGAETDKPVACRAPGCSHEGQPFVACACEDGLHDGSEEAKNAEENEETDDIALDDDDE